MGLILPKRNLSRRQLIQWSGLATTGLLLNGCGSDFGSAEIGRLTEPLNQRVQDLMTSQHPVPEYSLDQIEPEALLINTFDITPNLEREKFQLTVGGEVNNPLQLSLAEIEKMPLTSMVIRHICVEGWAAIVQWGGVRLRDLIALVQPKSNVRYVYFKSADGYYESWDLKSSLHPQTLLVYRKNGQPLPIENGAPLRLASPIKLGYKQSKWVTEVLLLSKLTPMKGFWEDQGYEWFGGL
jgi:DMSO/TMAO reductase YedYZ molybdopterin-dependent catalytic subunit